MSSLLPIIIAFGYAGIALIIFAESGFLLGFFLPGDSLLIASGLLAVQGYFNIAILVLIIIVAAVAGDSFGYATGRKFGPKIFVKENSFLFDKKYVARTKAFFERYGNKAVILARFVPIVRTFTPIMAGVGSMRYRTFVTFNFIGGALWGGGLLIISYIAGIYIPGLEKYIEYIVIGVVILSLLPILIEWLRSRENNTNI